MSQFIPASPSHPLCDALGKIPFIGLNRSSLCLQCLKAFCEVNSSTEMEDTGGELEHVITPSPQGLFHKEKTHHCLPAPKERVTKLKPSLTLRNFCGFCF